MPSASWEDVGGLAGVKRQLRELIQLPLKRPELLTKFGMSAPRGALLYGPPGQQNYLPLPPTASEHPASLWLRSFRDRSFSESGCSSPSMQTARKLWTIRFLNPPGDENWGLCACLRIDSICKPLKSADLCEHDDLIGIRTLL